MAAYLAVNKNGDEKIFEECPTYHRLKEQWVIETEREVLVYIDYHDFSKGTEWAIDKETDEGITLPNGSIEKLIGKKMTVMDEPYLLK